MKRIAGILAVATLWGCGVGVDDPEGMAAAGVVYGTDGQMLKATSSLAAESGGTATTAIVAPGSTSAPQDPIPAIDQTRTPVNPGALLGGSTTLGGYPTLPGR